VAIEEVKAKLQLKYFTQRKRRNTG